MRGSVLFHSRISFPVAAAPNLLSATFEQDILIGFSCTQPLAPLQPKELAEPHNHAQVPSSEDLDPALYCCTYPLPFLNHDFM